jgi:hypothetical protein
MERCQLDKRQAELDVKLSQWIVNQQEQHVDELNPVTGQSPFAKDSLRLMREYEKEVQDYAREIQTKQAARHDAAIVCNTALSCSAFQHWRSLRNCVLACLFETDKSVAQMSCRRSWRRRKRLWRQRWRWSRRPPARSWIKRTTFWCALNLVDLAKARKAWCALTRDYV